MPINEKYWLKQILEDVTVRVARRTAMELYFDDARYRAVYDRLSKLSIPQLARIIDNIDKVCLDTYNFDPVEKTFCPLAIAHGLDKCLSNPTDEIVQEELARHYKPVNVLKGVPGTFYTTNRRADLLAICELLIRLHRGVDRSLPQ